MIKLVSGVVNSFTQLDNALLEELMLKLTEDRSTRVVDCLPGILKELSDHVRDPVQECQEQHKQLCSQQELQQQQQQRFERRENTPHASEVTRLLNLAMDSGPGAVKWTAVESELSNFLRSLMAGRRQVGLKESASQTVQALGPLLNVLTSTADTDGSEVEKDALMPLSFYRGFYARAVSLLLHLHLSGFDGSDRIAWLKRCGWKVELYDILLPFIQKEVEPLEKELVYHFQEGKNTARREEPQHFFLFLQQIYTRLVNDARAHGWAPEGIGEQDGVNTLIALGSAALAATAVSVFRSAYGWHEESGYLSVKDFTIHGVNCLVDFLTKSGGIVHLGAQAGIVERLISPDIFCTYADAARSFVCKAFASGHQVLWRLEFLTNSPTLTDQTATLKAVRGTYHMLRCLEAILRRLAVVFALLPACVIITWNSVVVPSLVMFMQHLEDAKEEAASLCETRAELIITSFHLLDSVQAVCSAAEEWRERFCEHCGEKDVSTAQLGKMTRWREKLRREVTESTSQFLAHLFAVEEVSPRGLHAWDGILQGLLHGPSTGSNIVQEVMRTSIPCLIPKEKRKHLKEYCEATGANALANLLSEDVL
ncbi:hypothetical protein, conserved [Trypanosoma brucei gambiense DAL972]|uniref:Uncharacterized protein n=1 Tax=Trypanosoma brucei gambiense (strain MHOM/CI/86/DAL972) TaxID=679716 RepID=C9ZQ64_TRYB9|nr:hypothetical protein, conserved [Trypanosoma brucei gambiense DAL972]CBH11544.1 hypothetical protein, conserved [Trypanosoma brucei gambiense DAL972]|eukprot:XP_011773829.1 hypothetical protein, conserved [Trypanosoma brucei gambiense DAL972]